MAIMFCIECIISFVHIPPGLESKATPELQMIPLIRFYQDRDPTLDQPIIIPGSLRDQPRIIQVDHVTWIPISSG